MSAPPGVGKIPFSQLRDVLPAPPRELDAAVEEGQAYAANPAIGVPDEELGFFAYHYTASNLAAAFAEPRLMTVTALFPPGYDLEKVKMILSQLAREAARYNTRIIAGHTARYKGISLPLVSTTATGPILRERRRPEPGDHLLLIGTPGLETLKLLGKDVPLEKLTPLPQALKLHTLKEVKLMHDVSEGGIAGALLEIAEAYNVTLSIEEPRPPPGFPRGIDLLSAPSYGTLIAVAETTSPCNAVDNCTPLGRVAGAAPHLLVNGREYAPAVNTLWQLYGEETRDPVLGRLHAAALTVASTPGVEKLIPEVGMNMAYAPHSPRSPKEVAAIDGRIVKTSTGARLCGEPRYGASRHLAEVLIAAAQVGLPWRAAANTKVNGEILAALSKLRVDAAQVRPADTCPVAEAIRHGVKARALWYGPAPGLEPSLVLLAPTPEDVARQIRLLAEALNK